MKIMPITQQSLSNKPCVQNNQPNFEGRYRRLKLEELGKKGSLSQRVIDAFGEIIKFGTDQYLSVTVRKLRKGERIKQLLGPCSHPKRVFDAYHKQNLRFTVTDKVTKERHFMERFICPEKNDDPNVTVNESVTSLVQSLMDSFPQSMNWEGLAKALKGSKS